MTTTPKLTTLADLPQHGMLAGLDRAHLLVAMRLIPEVSTLGDEVLLAVANAVLLDRRHQGYADRWVGVVPVGARLATEGDR